jgi:recombination protein RecT
MTEKKQTTQPAAGQQNTLATQAAPAPASQRFTQRVTANFAAAAGAPVELSRHEKTLAQHLFLYLDNQFRSLDSKRRDGTPPIDWQNINLEDLALKAVSIVKAGLDAVIPNHVHAVPYLNGKSKKYDVDLRPGYTGKDFVARNTAMDPIKDIRYELVYKNDVFVPLKKGANRPVESYTHEIPNPFDRGEIVGGYGYIEYEDETKNQLIMVTDRDFKKARAAAPGGKFWDPYPDEMKFKTVVNRVYSKIPKDPKKSDAVAAIQSLEPTVEDELEKLEDKAHAGMINAPVVDIDESQQYPDIDDVEQVQLPLDEQGQPSGDGR